MFGFFVVPLTAIACAAAALTVLGDQVLNALVALVIGLRQWSGRHSLEWLRT